MAIAKECQKIKRKAILTAKASNWIPRPQSYNRALFIFIIHAASFALPYRLKNQIKVHSK